LQNEIVFYIFVLLFLCDLSQKKKNSIVFETTTNSSRQVWLSQMMKKIMEINSEETDDFKLEKFILKN
jgi:hypothetical protein